ncbi:MULTISPECIES: LuxR C-terminal-related transcriptional regulator [Streptomyces]|uniref:DNA-binding response regulator n=1 Tax=Streptomyces dengpaensis TaxID=2049881 RepID=A0ABM6T259_9ACTN|nr:MULTISPECIES: response regulator transcription factor [Streptomyces]AVH61014.1 DNA-binding response regulator [Streptomyces dengpaensis]
MRLVRAQGVFQGRACVGRDGPPGCAGEDEVDGVRGVPAPHRGRVDRGHAHVGVPVEDLEDACRVGQRRHRDLRTNYGLDAYVFDALRAGASGFLLKDTEPADLLQAIEVVAGGEALLSPSVTRTLIGEFVARPPDRATAPGLECLTRREREVTALAARGFTNEEIAAHMVISPFTAKTHISRAMTKLCARDRAELVVFAYESGLVTARGHAE